MACFALWPDLFQDALQSHPGAITTPPSLPASLPPLPTSLKIIDTCAGAGGKTLAMADALQGKGRFFAYDTSLKKLQALKRRATRAGLTNIQTCPLPEGQEDKILGAYQASADVVLVDAPCSGWGVLRRNPDLKWRQTAEAVTRLTQVQARLLSLYAPLVKPQGRLIYGVCTFAWEETRKQVETFLKNHPEFAPLSGGFLGPFPCDGFFVQAFVRKKPQAL
jgi:16S rRNA (cytosine967-C5)-methyltransferase